MSTDEDRDPADQADAAADSDGSGLVDMENDEAESDIDQPGEQTGDETDDSDDSGFLGTGHDEEANDADQVEQQGEDNSEQTQQQDGVLGRLSVLESEGAQVSREGREYVSFRVGHKVAPNKYVARRYLEDYDKLAMMWNEETKDLMMMPLMAEEAQTLSEQRPEQKLHAIQFEGDTDRLQPFLIKNDVKEFSLSRYLEVDQTQRFDSEWDEETGVIRVDMSQDPEVVNS